MQDPETVGPQEFRTLAKMGPWEHRQLPNWCLNICKVRVPLGTLRDPCLWLWAAFLFHNIFSTFSMSTFPLEIFTSVSSTDTGILQRSSLLRWYRYSPEIFTALLTQAFSRALHCSADTGILQRSSLLDWYRYSPEIFTALLTQAFSRVLHFSTDTEILQKSSLLHR